MPSPLHREFLVRAPWARDRIVCRDCAECSYAVRRLGKHHVLRRPRTPRQRAAVARARRQAAREAVRDRRLAAVQERERKRRVRHPQSEADWALVREEARREADIVIAEMKAQEQARREGELRAALSQDVEQTRAWLETVAVTAPTKRLREKAAKMLAEADRNSLASQLRAALAEVEADATPAVAAK
jgi:hypothetical protein